MVALPRAGSLSKLFLGRCEGDKELFLDLLSFDCFLTHSNLHAKVAHLGVVCLWPQRRIVPSGDGEKLDAVFLEVVIKRCSVNVWSIILHVVLNK